MYLCRDCNREAPATDANGDCIYCGGEVRWIEYEKDKEGNREPTQAS